MLRPLAAAAALCCLAAAAQTADSTAAARAQRPQLALPSAAQGLAGQTAIDTLGNRLADVAASYGKSPEALAEILRTDASARIDQRGHLFYVEEADTRSPRALDAPRAADATPLAPLDKTFTLHSRAGAKRTIYLDFNGAILHNTAWNNGGGDITALAYTIDADVDHFSTEELSRIQGIWQRVAEDYAPFDIDVTTEEPPQDRLTRANAADEIYGTTVLVTNHEGVYDCQCGGVAYVGVFDAIGDFNKPALVFYDMLANGDEKDVAEASSHESGHNLGLSHDGTSSQGYYAGHGTGPTGWAPIMGVGYYKELVQWSKGEYAGANNHEDDFVVMGNNGGPLRADDHGNDAAHATALKAKVKGTSVKLKGSGVIERRTDVDAFSFQAAAGAVKFKFTPDKVSGNLDIAVKLLDSNGNVIAQASPQNVINATLNATLPSAGTYTVTIDGVGQGDVQGTGYSDYGSLGQYKISGTAVAP